MTQEQVQRYGVRISPLSGEDIILVEQTSRLHPWTGNNPYTIDHDEDGRIICRHVDLNDDYAIAEAVRSALLGSLNL